MAKLWFGFNHVPSNTEKSLKKFLDISEKFLKDDIAFVYIDNAYDFKTGSKMLTVKVTDADVMKIWSKHLHSKYAFKKTSNDYSTTKVVKVKLQKSGGMRGTGKLPRKGEKQNNPTTREQEVGSIIYFREMFSKGKVTLKFISDEVGYAFDSSWMHNFEQQYDVFVKNIGKLKGHDIHLDSDTNKSDLIVKLAKKFGLTDAKDNWNPSDIWIMNISESTIKKETKGITSLEEYNAYLRDKFHSNEIIGVSLKKIRQGIKGKYATVTTDDIPHIDIKPKRVLFDMFQKNFIFETDGNISGFNLRVGYKAGTISKMGDVRVYLEGRQAGTSVQLGAVSAKLIPTIAEKYGKFDLKKLKEAVMADPVKYINDNFDRLVKHQAVLNKTGKFDLGEKTDLELTAGAMLLLYLDILLTSNKDILKSCYYSSTKMNDFSSIHCKLY